jgi:cytochrome P450
VSECSYTTQDSIRKEEKMEAVLNRPTKAPGPGPFELLRWGTRIKRDPLPTYEALQEAFGDYAWCPWPNKICLFVWDPEGIAHVLRNNHTNYEKTFQYEELKPLLGEGLLTSNGELWRHQRKIMAKQFHAGAIDEYMGPIQALTEGLLEALPEGELDVDDVFSALTLQIAGQIFFGAEVGPFTDVIGKGIVEETYDVSQKIRSAFALPLSLPTPANIRRRRRISAMQAVVESIIRGDQSGRRENVLSKLVAAGDISHEQIRDEVMTLLLAGHETTSNNLVWTCWFLARYPEWQERILQELHTTGKPVRELGREELGGLTVLRSVVKESLRLMPPVPAFARTAIADDTVGGYHVPAGTTVVIQPWVTHRLERLWKDPLRFDPARFFERAERRDDCAFIPFARGARSCIGEDLAMVEASYILASLVEKFDWRLRDGFEPRPIHSLSLQSENGLLLELRRR